MICPWGELVTLLSVRHLTTMDVDDMDTYIKLALQFYTHAGLRLFTLLPEPAYIPYSCRADSAVKASSMPR